MFYLLSLLVKKILHPFTYKTLEVSLTDGVEGVFVGKPQRIAVLHHELELAHKKRLQN